MSVAAFWIAVLLATIGHGYLWIGPVNRLHAWAGPRFIIDYGTLAGVLFFLALPIWVVWDWWNYGGPAMEYVWSSHHWQTRYLQLCVIWGAGKLVFDWWEQRRVNSPHNLLAWRQEKIHPEPAAGRSFAIGAYSRLLTALPGNQCLQLTIDHKRLAVPRLPTRLEGYRIAHLSDLHMTGRISPEWFTAMVAEVNRQEPDVVMITGDVLENEECWEWLEGTLRDLRAPEGVYFILGNHDYFVDVAQTREKLTELGFTCLSGRQIEATLRDTPVQLAGNERPWGVDELDRELSTARSPGEGGLRLFLIHTPDEFGWAHRQGADLVLAGHTHGGQIRFPILGAVACPSLHGTRYACGVFRRGDTVMHVSRGISGETPIRWNCPPEVAMLELTRSGRCLRVIEK